MAEQRVDFSIYPSLRKWEDAQCFPNEVRLNRKTTRWNIVHITIWGCDASTKLEELNLIPTGSIVQNASTKRWQVYKRGRKAASTTLRKWKLVRNGDKIAISCLVSFGSASYQDIWIKNNKGGVVAMLRSDLILTQRGGPRETLSREIVVTRFKEGVKAPSASKKRALEENKTNDAAGIVFVEEPPPKRFRKDIELDVMVDSTPDDSLIANIEPLDGVGLAAFSPEVTYIEENANNLVAYAKEFDQNIVDEKWQAGTSVLERLAGAWDDLKLRKDIEKDLSMPVDGDYMTNVDNRIPWLGGENKMGLAFGAFAFLAIIGLICGVAYMALRVTPHGGSHSPGELPLNNSVVEVTRVALQAQYWSMHGPYYKEMGIKDEIIQVEACGGGILAMTSNATSKSLVFRKYDGSLHHIYTFVDDGFKDILSDGEYAAILRDDTQPPLYCSFCESCVLKSASSNWPKNITSVSYYQSEFYVQAAITTSQSKQRIYSFYRGAWKLVSNKSAEGIISRGNLEVRQTRLNVTKLFVNDKELQLPFTPSRMLFIGKQRGDDTPIYALAEKDGLNSIWQIDASTKIVHYGSKPKYITTKKLSTIQNNLPMPATTVAPLISVLKDRIYYVTTDGKLLTILMKTAVQKKQQAMKKFDISSWCGGAHVSSMATIHKFTYSEIVLVCGQKGGKKKVAQIFDMHGPLDYIAVRVS